MSHRIVAQCLACETGIEVPYILLGAPAVCPSCGKTVIPKVPVGTFYPRTGYQMTYEDFHQLLREKSYRSTVSELLSRWFGYDIKGYEDPTSVGSHDGAPLDLIELHKLIQKELPRQRELYSAAMAFWR